MLIIEIHVDTIESVDSANADNTSPSTHSKREDERLKKAGYLSKITTDDRFWKAIKLSIPGSLMSQSKK